MKGRKRKTVLYWKQKISEAGWEYADVARLSEDRERMSHVNQW